jgi:iron complex transport system ATP-binding protein
MTTLTPTPDAVTGPTAAPRGIHLHEVRFGYDAQSVIVDGVTATLAPGRLTVMIGPNASGKTTLLRLMLGQLRPWSGAVSLGGEALAEQLPTERARRIAYVPQRGGVSFAFTVRQVVEMGRYAQPPLPAAVDDALASCDLTDVADRVFAHLSGGQQQRVMLARAIAQLAGAQPGDDGRTLLADEPVSSMDLLHVHRTMSQLRQLTRSGLAVLVVLHDLTLAARYADDVWLVHGGRIEAAGAWSAVMTCDVLSRVYQVALSAVTAPGSDRPVFIADPAPFGDTISHGDAT